MTLEETTSTPNLCVFCYKIIPPDYFSEENTARVGNFSALSRLLDVPCRSTLLSSFFGSCENCEIFVTQFSEVYHQMKCLELHLFSKLDALENIMKSADKGNLQTEFLKQLTENEYKDNSSSNIGGCNDFDLFRVKIKERCNHGRMLAKRQPRVLLNHSLVKTGTQTLMTDTRHKNIDGIQQNVLSDKIQYKLETMERDDVHCSEAGNDYEDVNSNWFESSVLPNYIQDSTVTANTNQNEQNHKTENLDSSTTATYSNLVTMKTEIDSSTLFLDTRDTDNDYYNDNFDSNAPKKLFECKILSCRKLFDVKEEFVKHQRICHPQNINVTSSFKHSHICQICGTSFDTKFKLAQHVEFHKNPEEWKFECFHCNKKCANKHNLTAHMAKHTEYRPFECEHCGKCFKLRNVLKRHLESHKNPNEWKHQCSICGRRCANKHNLTKHFLVHSDQYPWKCGECGKGLKSRELLKRHLEYHKKPEDWKHQCITCGARFVTRSNWKMHMTRKNEQQNNKFVNLQS